nr:hypothetical protein [bacterium]
MGAWEEKIGGRLEEIAAWHGQGLDEQAIASRLGVTTRELTRLAQRHVSLADALGRQDIVDRRVEEALYAIAIGQEVTDRTWELRDSGSDGKKRLVMVKKVVQHTNPDLAAVRIWLKSRGAQRWQGEEEEAPPDTAALVARAKRLIAEIEGQEGEQGE